jgi:hypothetical protein
MIHIGPHKTGSTYIQSSLLALDSVIRMRSNYIQPFSYDLGFLHPKIQSLFTKELMNLVKTKNFTTNFEYIQKMKIFLDKAYQQQHNILISTEDLCAVSSEGVKYLKNLLVDFRFIKIVIIFRDSLSRTLSNYRQLFSKDKFLRKKARQPDFKTYVNSLIVTKNLEKYYHTIIERYGDEFGYENIILIDYDGAIQAKKDLLHILLYELNDIPCDDLIQAIHPMINNINNANSAERHTSLLFSGVISEIRDNIYLKKCNISLNNQGKITRIILSFLGNQTLPSITTKLKNIYYNDSLQIDDVFRMKYSHQILYNNRNASIDAVEKQILVELDIHKFRNNAHWKKWTQNVILRLKSRSVIACPTTISTNSSINTSSISIFNHRNKLSPMKHIIKKDAKNNSSHTIRSSILDASNRYINNNDNNFNNNNHTAINDNSSSSQQSHVETVVDSYESIFIQSYLLLSILVIVFIILLVFAVIVHSRTITTQSQ